MKQSPENGSVASRTSPKQWVGVEAEDIPQGWMDDMTKRLLDVVNRNLIRLETAQQKVNDQDKDTQTILKETAQHQRLATQIRTDLERLRKLELKRQAKKPKVTVSDEQSFADIKRRIDRLAHAANADDNPDGTVG